MATARKSAIKRLLEDVGTVDQVGIEERVAKFQTRSIKKKSKLWGLTTAVSMVDLTTLEGKDTPGKVVAMCRKALRPHDRIDTPSCAAVDDHVDLVGAVGDSLLHLHQADLHRSLARGETRCD